MMKADLRSWGYAPGNYMCVCATCKIKHTADKRAWRCRACAFKAKREETTMGDHSKDFNFGVAITLLKDGHKVARAGWNGKGMWLELQRPDENSKMNLPYIFMYTGRGGIVPWLASQTDMLAEDWMVVDG